MPSRKKKHSKINKNTFISYLILFIIMTVSVSFTYQISAGKDFGFLIE